MEKANCAGCMLRVIEALSAQITPHECCSRLTCASHRLGKQHREFRSVLSSATFQMSAGRRNVSLHVHIHISTLEVCMLRNHSCRTVPVVYTACPVSGMVRYAKPFH